MDKVLYGFDFGFEPDESGFKISGMETLTQYEDFGFGFEVFGSDSKTNFLKKIKSIEPTILVPI